MGVRNAALCGDVGDDDGCHGSVGTILVLIIWIFRRKEVFLKKIKIMCQTLIISRHIGRIGRRSFDRRMRIASPLFVERRGELARLLNEVDKLSDRLHDEFSSISENDYRLFGPELKVLISALKALRRDSLSRKELKPYNDRMRQQISDLEELDHDIKAFRVDAVQNKELQATMTLLGNLDFSKLPK